MKAVGLQSSFLTSLRHFAADIKIAHSVFALPFAIAAFVLGKLPLPSGRVALLLLLCMITARSYAMGMNRFLDWRIDKANPRTSIRKIPSGALAPQAGLRWSLLAAAIFVAAAASISRVAGFCAVPLLAILAGYSLMKRVSWLTHWYLGFCLGMAPIAVSVAVIGTVSTAVLLVGSGVFLWTAGFDILYSMQDREFDLQHALHSVPGRFGSASSLLISRVCFAGMLACLSLAGWLSHAGTLYFLGMGCIACLLAYEHILVRDARDGSPSKNLNAAFFNMNAYVSVIYLAFSTLDSLLKF